MGHRITRAASQLSADEVKQRLRTDGRPWVRQPWWILYHALVAPRKAEEIARHTGVSATTVHRVIATYNHWGPAAINPSEKGGRHHQDLPREQEQALLQPFFVRAERGEIATAQEIQQAYEAQVKHAVHTSSISRLWHRHGWRKLVPRPRHSKANPAEQAAFQKKTSSRRSKPPWPPASPVRSDRC